MRYLITQVLVLSIILSAGFGQKTAPKTRGADPGSPPMNIEIGTKFPELLLVSTPIEIRVGLATNECYTDGRFCVTKDNNGVVHWGNLRSFKPFTVEWIAEGDLGRAIADYDKHRRTLYTGELLTTALQKLKSSGLKDVSESIGFSSVAFKRFKWQANKWYELSQDKLLFVRFIEYNGNIVIDDLTIVHAKSSSGRGWEIDRTEAIDTIALPEGNMKTDTKGKP